MEAKEVFESKIRDLVRLCSEIRTLADNYSGIVTSLVKQAGEQEKRVVDAKENARQVLADLAAYKDEFEQKKLSEHLSLNNLKKEAQKLFEEAQGKHSVAGQILQKAQETEQQVLGKLKEVSELKNELEQRKEKVKALVAQI